MKLSRTASELYEAISELTIIDAHEHLPAEAEYLAMGYSGLSLFATYFRLDLLSAGLDSAFFERIRTDTAMPVDEWWPRIKPFYEASKHTSYARGLRITARDVFGIDDTNDSTIHELSARVKADNKPGVYRRTLQERCRIRYSLTCVDRASFPDDPGLVGIPFMRYQGDTGEYVPFLERRTGRRIRSLEDAVEAAQSLMRADITAGAAGFKMTVIDIREPDAARAAQELKEDLKPGRKPGVLPALRDYLYDKCCDVVAEVDVPVAVHTGYWGDFRQLDPKFMLSFAPRRPDVRFDMFHLGTPMLREAALIGKNLRNVTLNLCWLPLLSQVQLDRMLDEIIDLVPVNKVIAFGGDYLTAVQKVWGNLVMARECIASALARRVDAGDFDKAEALRIARLWLHDNPTRIYRLPAR